MIRYFLLLTIFTAAFFAQVETRKWKAQKVDYQLEQLHQKETKINTSGFSTLLVSSAQVAYYKLFSDYDGDNCPFYPSCSTFFVQAVDETNIIKGSLMFADRFTRDLNFFKSFNSYPIHKTGQFYDPVYKYVFHSVEEIVRLEKSADD